jgi:hypothetical protein
MSGAAVCWICLDGGADDTGKPIVRDCACRGNDAGFAHMSCIIAYAEKKCAQVSIDSQVFEFTAPWEICPNCNQSYQNDLSVHIADAFVSFAKRSYGYPGNRLEDKMKIVEAIKLQIASNLSATAHVTLPWERDAAKDKIEILIHELLAMVDQLKEEHDLGGNKYIRYFEAFGYFNLGQLYSVNKSEQSTKTAIDYFSRARKIYNFYGVESRTKLITEHIDRARAESEGDIGRKLKVLKNIYHDRLKWAGQNAEETIKSGINYAAGLINANQSIEAERFLSKLTATSRQVYGEDHNCTSYTIALLKKSKLRLVLLLTEPDSDGTFQALRYENGGEICVVTGPIADVTSLIADEGQLFRVESAMVHPKVGCPVICNGLQNAPHLNGKLGEVRSFAKDSSRVGRFGVHFEEKGLKPAAVKPENLRIAFELPSV